MKDGKSVGLHILSFMKKYRIFKFPFKCKPVKRIRIFQATTKRVGHSKSFLRGKLSDVNLRGLHHAVWQLLVPSLKVIIKCKFL